MKVTPVKHHIIPCVALAYEGRQPSNVPKGAQLVTLYTMDKVVTALSWLNSKQYLHSNGSLAVGTAHAYDIPFEFMGASVILDQFEIQPSGSALNYIEEDACPIPGEVVAVRTLITRIENIHLRRFINTALSKPLVFYRFWTSPVTIKINTDFGTLAGYSRETAEEAINALCDQPSWQALAAAYGLLNYYGYIWCHEEDEYGQVPDDLAPDKVRYEMLLPALAELIKACPETGKVMDSLLSGRWRNDGNKISHRIGLVVQDIRADHAKIIKATAPRGHYGWQPEFVK